MIFWAFVFNNTWAPGAPRNAIWAINSIALVANEVGVRLQVLVEFLEFWPIGVPIHHPKSLHQIFNKTHGTSSELSVLPPHLIWKMLNVGSKICIL